MPINRDDIALIDRFIDGSHSEEDELRLAGKRNDPDFTAELEVRREVAEAIHEVSRQRLKRDLKSKLVNVNLEERPRNRFFYYAVAASLSLFFLVLWLLPGKETNEALFYSYYKPYPAAIHTRGSSAAEGSAIEAYEAGSYGEAASQINEILASGSSPTSDHLLLLLGNCYLNQNDISAAEEVFTTLMNNQDSIIRGHTQWFLALTYLKSGQMDNCRKLLEALEKDGGLYSPMARNLLEQLDRS